MFNFEKEWCTFDNKKGCFDIYIYIYIHSYFENGKELLKYHQFVSSFEHSNSTSNGS
jgi:hypothetical protein